MRRPCPRAVIRAAVSGLCAGATSGLVRVTFRLIQDGRSPWLVAAVLVGVVVLPVASILLLQTAYRDGGLDAGLSTQITADQVTAMAIGIVVLGERFSLGVSGRDPGGRECGGRRDGTRHAHPLRAHRGTARAGDYGSTSTTPVTSASSATAPPSSGTARPAANGEGSGAWLRRCVRCRP